jgi:fucose permease
MTSATARQSHSTGDHALDDDATRRLSTETKAAFKTTEFIAYLGAVVAVIIASIVVKHTDGHDDYFRADKALFYIVLLTIGYMVARGIAKAGSPDRYDAKR